MKGLIMVEGWDSGDILQAWHSCKDGKGQNVIALRLVDNSDRVAAGSFTLSDLERVVIHFKQLLSAEGAT